MAKKEATAQIEEKIKTPFVVGIGASTGGLKPLQEFFGSMPQDSGLAFVIASSPEFDSLIGELLSPHTSIALHRIEHGMPLEANSIYLIPPTKNIVISNQKLLLTDQDLLHGHPVDFPIDIFFHSLAASLDDRAIGVILSGTGTDGTRGVRAINEAGGVVLVQSPESAEFDDMPRSVIDTGRADYVLPPRELARAIYNYVTNAPGGLIKAVPEVALDTALQQITALVARDQRVEELQSVNEELRSVNAEFQSKIGELTALNNDMDNLLQSTDIATVFLDKELRIRKFTPAVTRVIKLLEHDIGRPLDKIANGIEMERNELLGHVNSALDLGAHSECEVKSRSGALLMLRIDPYRDEMGRADGVVLTFVDISALKRAELQSQLLQTLMQAINSSSDFDAAMERTLSNVCQMFGWDYAEAWLPQSDEGMLKCCSTFITRPDLAPFQSVRCQLKLPAGTGLPGRVWSSKEPQWVLDLRKETELILHAGVAAEVGLTASMSVPVLVPAKSGLKSAFGIPILAENDVEVILAFFMRTKPRKRDLESVVELLSPVGSQLGTVVQRKRLDAALRAAYTELQQKNEELEQFVHTVSHDLKSPLVSIGGVLGMLKEELQEGRLVDAGEIIATGEETVARMQGLIEDLLNLSRIGRVPDQLKPVELQPLIDEVLDAHATELEKKGVVIELHLDTQDVSAERTRVAQVLDNLIGNVLKYACDGPQPRIEIGSRAADGEVYLFVKDNGLGIEPQQQETVFGLFQQLDPSREGSGVGLAIVRRIMEVHHGRVWLESTPGEGATFWLAFPTIVGETVLSR